MNSFGVSESLILGGVLLVNAGRSTEGFGAIGMGLVFGFIRFTTWFGMKNDRDQN